MTALRQLASVLGATLLIEEHDDLVATVARVVRERGSTYIMVGESLPRRGLARLREPLPQRLMRATPPGVDVRIVAHRGRKEEERVNRALPRRPRPVPRPRRRLPDRPLARGPPLRALPRRSTRSSCPSPGPRSPAARSTRRCGWPGRERDPDARLPGGGAEELPLECSIPKEAAKAMPMLEAIEQRASAQGVPVDARIERGRSYRHALARLLERESFDRVVVPATADAAPASPATTSSGCCEGPGRGIDPPPGPEDKLIVTGGDNGAQRLASSGRLAGQRSSGNADDCPYYQTGAEQRQDDSAPQCQEADGRGAEQRELPALAQGGGRRDRRAEDRADRRRVRRRRGSRGRGRCRVGARSGRRREG